MTINEAIKNAICELNKNEFIDSNIIAKELLCYTLSKNKQYLLINKDIELNDNELKNYKEKIVQIINGKPLQYITNKQEFMGYDFYVDENVLIPQPDTEIIVGKVIDLCSNISKQNENIEILDLCTGSGAIAIALDKILNKDNNIKIYASDISQKALEVAKKNAKNLDANVTFINSDMFENINKKFDIIVSNPPYIETDIIKTLAKDVQAEPRLALNGGDDGLKFYRIIANNAYHYLKTNGKICFEIGYNQNESVVNIFKEKYNKVQVFKDLSENYRCIIAEN